jgi:hypothetical protein
MTQLNAHVPNKNEVQLLTIHAVYVNVVNH